MLARLRSAVLLGFGLLCLMVLIPDKIVVWMDDEGHTYMTDSKEPPAPGARPLRPEDLARSWGGDVTGPALRMRSDSSRAEDRLTRELVAAHEDIARGEVKQGLAQLRRLWRENPGRPEIGFLLAQVEHRRGRLAPAREALEAALSVAAEMPDPWREAALKLRREIAEEIEFASKTGAGESETLEAQHFSISYDHDFAGRAYGDRVLALLEQARRRVERSMGRTLDRTLEVRLYTKADYLDAYRHRFGFATVGFYDGVIHVVSARHPRQELYALLVHEYVHALFADAVGGHRPFFLNEGLADGEEERARGRSKLARGEWRELLEALRADTWIPLRSLVNDFGEVKGKRALLAYLESRAAVEMIEESQPDAIARWLDRCAEGVPWEEALRAETGWDTADLEFALQDAVRSRFPEDPLASLDRGAAKEPTPERVP